jgi:hypothetical protein
MQVVSKLFSFLAVGMESHDSRWKHSVPLNTEAGIRGFMLTAPKNIIFGTARSPAPGWLAWLLNFLSPNRASVFFFRFCFSRSARFFPSPHANRKYQAGIL